MVPLLRLISRLLAWYAVVTALFRCPSSAADITDNSPVVCKPYLTSRSFVAPYIEPYYNEYAAPYLNAVRPYTASFEQNIYNPSVEFGKQSYKTYGAPRVLQAKVYGQDQWKMNLRPKIHTYQSQAKQYYDVSVAPQLEKARVVAEPYYILNRDCVLRVYDSYILPAYSACRPYADKAYAVGEKFAVETGIPYAKSTWASTVILFDRTIWPQIRILYGENVEPQLVRIRERLGRYRDGKRLKTAFEDIDSTPEPSAAESSISSGPSTISSATLTESSEESSVAVSEESSQPSLTPEQEEEKVRETIANDLKNWQEKFAKAADKGTEDLEQRVKEITDRQINSQVQGVGEALIVQLEETSKSECSKFKKAVQKIVKGLSEEGSSEDAHKAEEELSAAVRQAGLSIRGKAQALRNWKEAFDRETISLVHAASESTLEVIDNIRDLGLQEIGMRWAWMDGVTYKDWSKYHEVRKTFDMWRTEVGSVATDHEGFKRAKDAAIDIESRGMAVAEETAKELGRLKEVGKWKIQAADTSDDFSSKHVPPGVAGIAQKVMKQASSASEQLTGTPQGAADGQKTSEAASTASSKIAGIEEQDSEKVNPAAKGNAGQGSDQVSEAIIGTPPPAHESVAPEALNLASSASSAFSPAPEPSTPLGESSSNAGSSTSQTPKKIYNGAMAQEVRGQKPILEDLVDDDATYSEKIQSFIEQAGEKYTDITNAVNEALLKATRTQGTAESITSVAGEKYSEALLAASRALLGTEKGAIESVTNVASERYVEAVAA